MQTFALIGHGLGLPLQRLSTHMLCSAVHTMPSKAIYNAANARISPYFKQLALFRTDQF